MGYTKLDYFYYISNELLSLYYRKEILNLYILKKLNSVGIVYCIFKISVFSVVRKNCIFVGTGLRLKVGDCQKVGIRLCAAAAAAISECCTTYNVALNVKVSSDCIRLFA